MQCSLDGIKATYTVLTFVLINRGAGRKTKRRGGGAGNQGGTAPGGHSAHTHTGR